MHTKRSVVVRYRQNGVDQEVEGRCVVLATPATVSHRVAVDLHGDIRDALGKVVYGPYVSAAFLTDETDPQPWDTAYGIATPKRSFNVVLNQASSSRAAIDAATGQQHHDVLAGNLARKLMELDDEAILRIYSRTWTRSCPDSAARSSNPRSSAGRPVRRTASRAARACSRP